MVLTRPLCRLVAFLAVLAFLPACGSSASPEKWATRMCSAAEDWMTSLQARNTQLQTDLAEIPPDDIEAIKDLTVAFLDGAVMDTNLLVDQVANLPAPRLSPGLACRRACLQSANGQEIHDGVLSAFTQARDLFVDARDQVAGLDTSDAAAFTQALTDLGTTMSQAGTEIATSVQGLENAELDAAFNDTPACTTVSSG